MNGKTDGFPPWSECGEEKEEEEEEEKKKEEEMRTHWWEPPPLNATDTSKSFIISKDIVWDNVSFWTMKNKLTMILGLQPFEPY